MAITLTRYICPVCGGVLNPNGDNSFKCRNCGSVWEKERIDDYNKILEKFDVALREQRQEDLAKLARRRYDEVTKENVSNEEVKRICNEILDLNPDDFFSQFYLATCNRDYTLARFFSSIDIEKHSYAIERILDYVIPALQPRWINAVSTLIEKAYKNKDVKKYDIYRTRFEAMAAKVKNGIFDPRIPRDIFVAYSSKDMNAVDELVHVLEENGLECFVAASNLRHGSGAVEKYREAIRTAMRKCKAVVFISSTNSRSSECDAINEICFIEENLPNMLRIEFLTENYKGTAVERIFKGFFDGLEYCTSPQEVAKRYFDKQKEEIKASVKHQTDEEEKRRLEEEIQQRLEAEFAEKLKAEEKRKAEQALEFKTIKYDNGDYYEGTVLNGKPHGKGTMTYANAKNKTVKGKKESIEDLWAIRIKEISFKAVRVNNPFYFADGKVYDGDWVNGKRQGKGKYTFVNGDVYEGDFENGKHHGKGKFTLANGDVYEGDFVDDNVQGKGKYTLANGIVLYEGDWVDNKYTGKGKLTLPNGKIKKGYWENGEFKGKFAWNHKG